MTVQLSDANIRSSSYYMAETTVQCRYCDQWTRALALAVPAPHEILVEDEWQPADAGAFIFYVIALPDGVRRRLTEASGRYRLTRDPETPDPYWANHCEHCDEPVNDDELHCEAGGFMPGSVEEAQTIALCAIREAFEAAAAGYAVAPEFFVHMRRR
jgi:hypothetical protein